MMPSEQITVCNASVCVYVMFVCVFVRVLAVTPAAQFHLSAAATRSHDILRSGKELMPDRREQLN